MRFDDVHCINVCISLVWRIWWPNKYGKRRSGVHKSMDNVDPAFRENTKIVDPAFGKVGETSSQFSKSREIVDSIFVLNGELPARINILALAAPELVGKLAYL